MLLSFLQPSFALQNRKEEKKERNQSRRERSEKPEFAHSKLGYLNPPTPILDCS
jgi:hypothetical protein